MTYNGKKILSAISFVLRLIQEMRQEQFPAILTSLRGRSRGQSDQWCRVFESSKVTPLWLGEGQVTVRLDPQIY